MCVASAGAFTSFLWTSIECVRNTHNYTTHAVVMATLDAVNAVVVNIAAAAATEKMLLVRSSLVASFASREQYTVVNDMLRGQEVPCACALRHTLWE